MERFLSRGLHLCKFIETKERIYIRKEFRLRVPPFFLRDSRASEARARVKITRPSSRGVNFTRARVFRICLETNMAAISLFWNTSMAIMASCETLYMHKTRSSFIRDLLRLSKDSSNSRAGVLLRRNVS